jgi:hypothetical protein
MSRAGTDTISGETVIFAPEDGGCTAFRVHCQDNSLVPVEINVERLHGNDWGIVRPGRDVVYRMGHAASGGITKVTARGVGGDADIDWEVVADTSRNDER